MADKTKLLIVEDDEYLLPLFRFALLTRGSDFEISIAGDSDNALDLAHKLKPDLILLDILLPGDLDGIEVCRQIRSDPDMRGTGVIMVTAVDDAVTRQRAIEAGAADYWLKPINTRGLADRVRAVLSLKRVAPPRHPAPEPIEPRTPPTRPIHPADPPALDKAVDSIRTALAGLDPDDWAEIQALAEARLAHRKRPAK
jgi:DNA-binding response OmpR family regulator